MNAIKRDKGEAKKSESKISSEKVSLLKKGLLAAILVISAFAMFTAVASATDIYVPEGGNQTIQQAVNNATPSDTIIVRDGTYNENVNVNVNNLTIRSENGSASTIVNASNPNDHVFYVTADYVNISGFMVQNATGVAKAGIYLNHVEHCNISSNNVTSNYYGIYLLYSSSNTLSNNNASNNDYGIYLYYSSNNTLSNNNANENTLDGIILNSSSNNTLANNTASDNYYGISLHFSSSNMLTNNTANSNDDYGIYLWWSSNNTLTNNTANSNTFLYGIYLNYYSSYNTLTNNTANSNTVAGIYLDDYSSDNTLSNNNANENGNNGIWLSSSSNNNTLSNNNANSNIEIGIYLDSSSNNNLSNNTANSTNYGIYLWSSSNNNLSNNNANLNVGLQGYGIYLYKSSNNNTLTSNTANENKRGIYLDSSIYNTVTNNTANSNDGVYGGQGIYLDDSSYNTITNNTANSNVRYGIWLDSWSNYNTLSNNTANENNWGGICLDYSNHNTLTNNNANENYDGGGIHLYYLSNYNTLSNNTANSNDWHGIYLYDHSSYNTLTNNTASNNTLWDFYSDGGSHDNTIKDLSIASYPTTISFIYDQGIKIRGVTTPEPDPAGKVNIGKYVNATSVTANSWIFLNVSYTEADVIDVVKGSLLLYKWNGTAWVFANETGKPNGVNTIENYVYGNVTSFSQIAPFGNPETTPPAAITDLATSNPTRDSITLTWTAPGDNGDVGTASEYDIRYSTSMITEANWDSATRTGEPTPKVAGSRETYTVTGLSSGTTYYFAIKTEDEVPNLSPVSNSPSGTTESVRRRGGRGGGAPRDSDGDGLSDIDEMLTYKTEPNKADTDGGGVNDGEEVARGTDPLDPTDDIVVTPTPSPTPMPAVTPTMPTAVTPTPSPTPTPTPPGFEAVLSIVGLLAVAYLVSRRR